MHTQFVTVQNISIRVKETGDGQPVLFVHGNPDSADLWDGIIERLPSGFRYLAPDLPGFGQSGDARGFDWSIANRGQWAADVLAACGVSGPVVLVAHDHGGPFAASFAVSHPDRVKGMVLQNTLFSEDYHWHFLGKLWRTPLLGEYLAFWQPFRITLPVSIIYMRWGSPGLTPSYIRDLQKTWTRRMGRAVLPLYRTSSPKAFNGWAQKLNALIAEKPTLVLWGEQDKYLPVWIAEGWQAHGATLHRFPDAGHWLMIEKPDEYARHVGEFLQSLPA
jgi:haloalkane dehalogenase